MFLSSEFFGCLGRLYSCEESGKANCPDTERCLSIEPVVAEVDTIDAVQNKDGKQVFIVLKRFFLNAYPIYYLFYLKYICFRQNKLCLIIEKIEKKFQK